MGPFNGLLQVATLRRQLLKEVHSLEEYDLVVVIGAAAERGEPFGFKQLELALNLPTSTLQRRLSTLIERKVIKKVMMQQDGRRVLSLPTKRTVDTYHKISAALSHFR